MFLRLTTLPLFVAGLILMACTYNDVANEAENPEVVTPPNDVAAEVEMTETLRFAPESVTIEAGETVRWRNTSTVSHTVTADPEMAESAHNVELPEGAEPFDSGQLEPGDTFEHTFEEPGTYRYVCRHHEAMGMLGEIRVTSTE